MDSPWKYWMIALPLVAVPMAACAQDIENDVPISAEATTAIVPGKSADVEANTGQPRQAAKPDRIYTDGALADPTPQAADLGMASPGNKTVLDVDN